MTNQLPEGKALLMETEIGVASAEEMAELLRSMKDMKRVDDNDRHIILQTASAIESIPQVLDTAVRMMNSIMAAHDEETRFFTAKPMIPISIVDVGMVNKEDYDEG